MCIQGQQCAITRGVSTGLQDDSEPTTVQYSEIKHENPRSTVDPGALCCYDIKPCTLTVLFHNLPQHVTIMSIYYAIHSNYSSQL